MPQFQGKIFMVVENYCILAVFLEVIKIFEKISCIFLLYKKGQIKRKIILRQFIWV